MIKVTQSKRKSISILRVLKLIRRIISIAYKVHHQRSHSRKQYYNWCLVIMATMLVGFSSCDEYEPKDNTIHVGYVLCEDHSCMRPEDYFRQSKQKGIGVVFAEQTKDHPLMAVMLEEINNAFCDSLGLSNGTSGSLTAFDGAANTRAMQNSYLTEAKKGSPLAMQLFHFHGGGQSDYLPSVAEQRLLIASAKVLNPIIEQLGGTPIALDGDCWYWTSTEVAGNNGKQAWLCSAANGGIIETPKTEKHKARAIIQINYGI